MSTLDDYFGKRKRAKMDYVPLSRVGFGPYDRIGRVEYPKFSIRRNRRFRRRRPHTYLSRRKLAEPASALKQSVMINVPVRYNSTIARTQSSYDNNNLDAASIGINSFTQTGFSILNPPAYKFYSNAYKFYKIYALKIDAVFTNLSETDNHRIIIVPTDYGIISKVQNTSVSEFAKLSTQNGAITFDLGPKGSGSDTHRYSANINAAHVFGYTQKRYNFEKTTEGTTGSTFYSIGAALPSQLAQWNFIMDTKDGEGNKSISRMLVEFDITWVVRFYGPKDDLGLSEPLGVMGTTPGPDLLPTDPAHSDIAGDFESINIDG